MKGRSHISVDTLLALGNSHYKSGRYSEAISAYTEALQRSPSLAIGYYNRSLVYSTLGDHVRAEKDRKRAFKTRPDLEKEWGALARSTASAFVSMGNHAIDLKDFGKALEHYSEAVLLNPVMCEAHVGVGLAHAELGNSAAAINAYSTAINLNPRCVEAYFNRANRYVTSKEWERAISDYSSVLSLDSNDWEAYHRRSQAYVAMGDATRAEADHAAALRLNPELED